MTTPRPVTADTLTDEQIHALREAGAITSREAVEAVSPSASRSRYEQNDEYARRKEERLRLRERLAGLVNESSSRPVAGPDGDNPITDEQIRDLRPQSGTLLYLEVWIALSPGSRSDERARARARCAAAYNARHAGKEGR